MEKKVILVADDQKETVRIITKELHNQYDYLQVINAGNGAMAVRVAEEELPDIVLMDWDMPVMDGIEATKRLRNSERTRDIPVIMATGRMTSAEDLRVALEAGAVDYVRKPIDFVELSARINTVLRLRDQNRAIQALFQSEIELKNRKLTTTSMLIVEQNGLLKDFYEDLNALEKNAAETGSKLMEQIRSLKRRVRHHFDVDKSWDTFKLHFEEVHPYFFNAIQELGQDISHKDLKLCAYIKLGLDNKEIANLLNVTAPSARVTLSRLKRKLNLEEEDNLREVIGRI